MLRHYFFRTLGLIQWKLWSIDLVKNFGLDEILYSNLEVFVLKPFERDDVYNKQKFPIFIDEGNLTPLHVWMCVKKVQENGGGGSDAEHRT